jgi:hypothetical protein
MSAVRAFGPNDGQPLLFLASAGPLPAMTIRHGPSRRLGTLRNRPAGIGNSAAISHASFQAAARS